MRFQPRRDRAPGRQQYFHARRLTLPCQAPAGGGRSAPGMPPPGAGCRPRHRTRGLPSVGGSVSPGGHGATEVSTGRIPSHDGRLGPGKTSRVPAGLPAAIGRPGRVRLFESMRPCIFSWLDRSARARNIPARRMPSSQVKRCAVAMIEGTVKGYGRGRILVVDDDASVRQLVATILADEGFEVEQAVDGVDALAKIAAQAYDAIVSDLQMPRLDGLSARDPTPRDRGAGHHPLRPRGRLDRGRPPPGRRDPCPVQGADGGLAPVGGRRDRLHETSRGVRPVTP